MTKRMEQSRRHGFYDPRFEVKRPVALPAGPPAAVPVDAPKTR